MYCSAPGTTTIRSAVSACGACFHAGVRVPLSRNCQYPPGHFCMSSPSSLAFMSPPVAVRVGHGNQAKSWNVKSWSFGGQRKGGSPCTDWRRASSKYSDLWCSFAFRCSCSFVGQCCIVACLAILWKLFSSQQTCGRNGLSI